MTRRRYVWDPEVGALVEMSTEQPKADSRTSALWGDRHYDGMQATDGTDISSRAKHRRYMKKHGLTTADDFKQTWERTVREREHYQKHGGSIRRSDVLEAIHKVQGRR